jgi:predicted MFS family arabinose efflux permease
MRSRRATLGLITLGAAAFMYVTAESLPIGLLPQLSSGLNVSGGSVGLLVTVYAAMAGLAAVPVTAWAGNLPRRPLVVTAVAMLAVSQLCIAVAPDFAVVMAARVFCALAHGVFWAILAPVAASLDVPERAARSTAVVFTGNSLALVLGTPIATALGAAFGWRIAFAAVGVAGALVCVALYKALPPLSRNHSTQSTRDRLQVVPTALRNASLLAVCAITAIVVIGHFSAYTYITSLIHRDAHVSGLPLSLVLLAFGAAGIIGNLVAGSATDHRPRLAATAVLTTLLASLVALAIIGPGAPVATIIAMVCWGAAFTALPVCLQSAVLRVAPDHPDTASAIYVVAFQIGIGGGALAGALLVDGGQLASLPLVAAGCAAIGLVLMLASRRAFPRQTLTSADRSRGGDPTEHQRGQRSANALV